MDTTELEALLTDMVEGYLRRAYLPDETIVMLIAMHPAAPSVARWLAQQAPELRDANIEDCPVEL